MRTVPAHWRRLAVGAALMMALAPAVLRAAPAAPATDAAVNPVEKLRKDLDKVISVKLERQGLPAAVEMLKEKTKINFILDTNTIQQQLGFDPNQPPAPIEVDLKDVKVKSALRSLFNPYGLSYVVLGDTVVITTDQMAMYRQMRQRVSIDLDKVEFAAALKQLGRDTATNLILDARVEKEAKATVSMNLEDVPLETAVRLLSEMAGLKPVRVGNVLFVTSKQNAGELRNDPDLVQPGQPQGPQLQDILVAPPGIGVPGGIGIPGGLPPGSVIGPAPGIPPVVPPALDKKADEKPIDPDAKPAETKPPVDAPKP